LGYGERNCGAGKQDGQSATHASMLSAAERCGASRGLPEDGGGSD
jgi:hypothetical protein